MESKITAVVKAELYTRRDDDAKDRKRPKKKERAKDPPKKGNK